VIRYIAVRLGQAVLTLLIISIVIFGLSRFMGDPSLILLPITADAEVIQQYRHSLGLDMPPVVQYGIFIKNLVLHGDLGVSIRTGRPVVQMIGEVLPNTIRLAVASMFIIILTAVPLGVVAALRRGTVIDAVARIIAVTGLALPHFWLGILFIMLFCIVLRVLPPNMDPSLGLKAYILPSITLATYAIAGVMRLTRSSMLEVLDTEYIKYTRSKGILERLVVFKHALRNALIPVITLAGLYFVMFMAGSVAVETVFSWPGVGLLAYTALMNRDLPVLQGAVLIVCAVVVVGNLLVDISYGLIDPRARLVGTRE